MPNNDCALLISALDFAAQKHQAQKRKNGTTPYINHPIRVMNILAVEGGVSDPELLAAAALHDTLEDTDATREELTNLFGHAVCSLVEEVTDNKSLPKAERKALQISHAGQLSPAAQTLKLADKIANLRDMLQSPPADWDLERKEAYFDWAEQVVAQLRGNHPGLEAVFDTLLARKGELKQA